MADELGRWAAERAPALLSRAEAEAVALLRDALLDAALRPKPEPKRVAARPARKTGATGEALWAYCITRAGEPLPDGLEGVHGGRPTSVESGDLAALVSRCRWPSSERSRSAAT